MLDKLRLWRENRLDQEYALTPAQIVNGKGLDLGPRWAEPGFTNWLESHEPPLMFLRALTIYLAAPDGLNSTWEPAELRELEAEIWNAGGNAAWGAYMARLTRHEATEL